MKSMSDLREMILEKLNSASKEELSDINELVEELEIREKENLCQKYIPNVKSEEFIKLVGSNKVFVNLFIAANGVGKSCSLANIVTNICFGPQNEWFKGLPLFENFPYYKRGRIISDPTTIKTKIVPELKKWFPSNRYTEQWMSNKDGKGYESKWTTDTGFEFDIMSNEQDTKEFESTDLGFCIFDEPSRRDIYKATVARMRAGGIIIWGFTPLTYSAWIKDDIYDKRDGKMIDYVEADVWDNCRDIEGTRGVLSKTDIDRMISQYSEDEKEARINGKFGHLLGRVHKAFNRKIHVIKPFKIDKHNYVVVKAHDTHPREPDHILWMAIRNDGQKFFVNELIISDKISEMAAKILQIEQINGYRMLGDDVIDPSAFNADTRHGELSVADKFWDLGVEYRRGSKDLTGCIIRMDEALSYEEKGGELIKSPEIFYFDTCEVAIKQMEEYVWDEYIGKSADEKQSKGKPKDKNDHQVENAHRLLKEEYKFKEVQPITMNNILKRKQKRNKTVNTSSINY